MEQSSPRGVFLFHQVLHCCQQLLRTRTWWRTSAVHSIPDGIHGNLLRIYDSMDIHQMRPSPTLDCSAHIGFRLHSLYSFVQHCHVERSSVLYKHHDAFSFNDRSNRQQRKSSHKKNMAVRFHRIFSGCYIPEKQWSIRYSYYRCHYITSICEIP